MITADDVRLVVGNLEITHDSMFMIIGRLVIYIAIIIIMAVMVTAIIALYMFNTRHMFFPKFTLLLITAFEGGVKAFFNFLRLDVSTVDRLNIDLRNIVDYDNYISTGYSERGAFLPQCLRSVECPAPTTPEGGIICKGCGKCEIKNAKAFCEELGYKVFAVAPGGTFVTRMMKKYEPTAAIGVACVGDSKSFLEVCEAMQVYGQAVILLKDGCVNTVANWDIFYKLVAMKKE